MEHDKANVGSVRARGGRPRSFDREAALEKAMLVFWRHGYETTSINDLTAAMGITPPSLYSAFGDKRRLFLEAVRRYAGEPGASDAMIAEAPSAWEAARIVLNGAVALFTGDATPPGCLLASATASGSAASQDVQAEVACYRRHVAASLKARIERDVDADELPHDLDAAGLAGMIVAVIQGLSVMARDGAPRATLEAVAEATLRTWPSRSRRHLGGSHHRAPISAEAEF